MRRQAGLLESNDLLESRMRETRTSGSEGGGAQLNALSLPLSKEGTGEGQHGGVRGMTTYALFSDLQ